jgi:hypothetical protein
MKVGIIRCQLTEDICPGCTDCKVTREGIMAFEETAVRWRSSMGPTKVRP